MLIEDSKLVTVCSIADLQTSILPPTRDWYTECNNHSVSTQRCFGLSRQRMAPDSMAIGQCRAHSL